MNLILLLAVLGFILSVYTWYIESKPTNYKPICDISKNISCTKAFKAAQYISQTCPPVSITKGIFTFLARAMAFLR